MRPKLDPSAFYARLESIDCDRPTFGALGMPTRLGCLEVFDVDHSDCLLCGEPARLAVDRSAAARRARAHWDQLYGATEEDRLAA